MYTRWAWSWWIALAVPIAVAVWLVSSGGLTSPSEGYGAAGFAVAVVVLLVLGRRAAGKPEAMALASARVPFQAKVGIVWLAIFAVIALILNLFQLDTAWIKENASYIIKGVEYTLFLALGAIVLAVLLALFGSLGRLSKNPVAYGLSGFTSFFRGRR